MESGGGRDWPLSSQTCSIGRRSRDRSRARRRSAPRERCPRARDSRLVAREARDRERGRPFPLRRGVGDAPATPRAFRQLLRSPAWFDLSLPKRRAAGCGGVRSRAARSAPALQRGRRGPGPRGAAESGDEALSQSRAAPVSGASPPTTCCRAVLQARWPRHTEGDVRVTSRSRRTASRIVSARVPTASPLRVSR